MDKIEIAVEMTKSIILICQKAKSEFASSIRQVFQSQPTSSPLRELPCKRFVVSSSKETKQSTSNEEPELDQLPKDSKIFEIDSPVKVAKLLQSSPSTPDQSSEEIIYDSSKSFEFPGQALVSQSLVKNEDSIGLSEISSSDKEDLESETIRKDIVYDPNSTSICSITDFEQTIQYHKSQIAPKSILEEISKFISRYWKMGFKDRKFMRSILEKIDVVKVDPEDKQGKAVFSEIQGKVRKIFSESLFIEDWDNLYQTMKSAINSENNAKIDDIIKRAHNALPLDLNEKMREELSKFPKVLKRMLKTSKGETAIKVKTLLKKINPKDILLNKTRENPERIAGALEFNNLYKKAINTIEAKKTLKPRRNY